MVMKY